MVKVSLYSDEGGIETLTWMKRVWESDVTHTGLHIHTDLSVLTPNEKVWMTAVLSYIYPECIGTLRYKGDTIDVKDWCGEE